MGQSTFVPLHVTLPPHRGSPGSPIGAARQVPAGVRSHRSQLPLQAVEQQTPFAHVPELHCTLAVQT